MGYIIKQQISKLVFNMCTDTRFTEANEKTLTTTLIALYTDLSVPVKGKNMIQNHIFKLTQNQNLQKSIKLFKIQITASGNLSE